MAYVSLVLPPFSGEPLKTTQLMRLHGVGSLT